MNSLHPLLSVVIINFNSGRYIFRCLDCLKAQSYPSIEVLVVDNASKDDSREGLELRAAAGEIQYFHRDENGGASSSNNLGIRNSKGSYVLVLNADVFLEPKFIERAMGGFSLGKKVGSVTGKLLSDSQPSIIDSTGVVLCREGTGMDRGYGLKDRGQFHMSEKIAGVCCAASIYSREFLEDVASGLNEYFDEDFFAFYEDLDLSVRGLLLGWETFFVPDACGFHVRGGSTSKMTEFVRYLGQRNEILFYYKTFKPPSSKFDVFHSAYRTIRRLANSSSLNERIDSDVQKLLPKMLAKRAKVEARYDYSRLNGAISSSYIEYIIRSKVFHAFR